MNVLPTLIVLTVSSALSLAAAAEPTANPVKAEASIQTPVNVEEIRKAHKQYMQNLTKKIHEAKDPAEQQRLRQEQLKEMQQHMQDMQELLGQAGMENVGKDGMMGPGKGCMEDMQTHRANMEKRLENIEKLLEQLVAKQAK